MNLGAAYSSDFLINGETNGKNKLPGLHPNKNCLEKSKNKGFEPVDAAGSMFSPLTDAAKEPKWHGLSLGKPCREYGFWLHVWLFFFWMSFKWFNLVFFCVLTLC